MTAIRPGPKPAIAAAIAVLRAALDSSTGVASRDPRIWPRLYVRVSSSGGSSELLNTDIRRLLVECYADSDAACEQLSSDCLKALRNTQGHIIDLGRRGKVFLRGFDNEAGPVTLDDPKVPDYRRWQFQGDLMVSNSDNMTVS